MPESHPSTERDKDVVGSAVPTPAETSPAAGRDTESCEPVFPDAQQLGNRRRKSHSPEAWEAVKADIARLYLDENRRLKDVMAILEQQRGFHASPKMYKTKLTQWKFFKNNRQADVANLLYLQRHRLAMGKESTFRRNGRAVDVAAYIRRKGLRPVDLLKAARPGDLPPTLRCRTPPPPPPLLPREMDAPDDFLFQEAYLHWSLDHPLMPPQMEASYFKELDRCQESEAMRSVTLLTHGCWLLSIGRMNEGGSFCRRAFSIIDSVLNTSAHFAVYELMGAVSRYPDLGIQRALWSYLSKYAARVGGVNGRLQRMLGTFTKLARNSSLEHSVAMLQWGRRFSSNQSNGMFDGKPFDYTLIQPWDILPMNRSYHHRYYLNQGLWEADTIPTATIYSPEGDVDSWALRADLLIILGNQTAWADERIPTMAQAMLGQMPSDRPPGYLEFICLYALAHTNRVRCREKKARLSPEHERARNYLRRAIEVQSQAWQPGKNYYETLTLLEKWLREAGDEEEAEATRRKRDTECQDAFRDLCQ
ncbi:Clr5 domain-containing protein [Xylaria sp. FL1777]|nr:Clr5 domain-containing protein [Xylaria sp. FL1777]